MPNDTRIGPGEQAQVAMAEHERSQSPEVLRQMYPNSPGLFQTPKRDASQDAALARMYPNSPGLFKDGPPAGDDGSTAPGEQAQPQPGQEAQSWEAIDKELRADPEVGGANYEASRAAVLGVVDRFGSPELAAKLRQGAHLRPELFRAAARIARELKGAG